MVFYKVFKSHRRGVYHPKWDNYEYLSYRYQRLFFGSLIFRGRKLWAYKFLGDLKYNLKLREGVDVYWTFLIAMIRITPCLVLFPLKLGGVVQGVPLPILENKRYTFAVKWVIKLLRDKHRRVTLVSVTDALLVLYMGGAFLWKKKRVFIKQVL